MALLTAILSAGIISQAMAADCRTWTFTLQEGEEGKQWTAGICSTSDGGKSIIEVTCTREGFNLRYIPRVEGDFANQQRDFTFDVDGRKRPLFLIYEAMDGAFASTIPRGHTVFGMLKAGRSLNVADTAGKMSARVFSLKGASRALSQLAGKCRP